jgi:hypothetical protein
MKRLLLILAVLICAAVWLAFEPLAAVLLAILFCLIAIGVQALASMPYAWAYSRAGPWARPYTSRFWVWFTTAKPVPVEPPKSPLDNTIVVLAFVAFLGVLAWWNSDSIEKAWHNWQIEDAQWAACKAKKPVFDSEEYFRRP